MWDSISLVTLSFAAAVVNSGLALYFFTRLSFKPHARLMGALTMAIAIAGMHYIAMYSMRMAATIRWNLIWVGASILVAFLASLKALNLAYTLNKNYSKWLDLSSKDLHDRWLILRGSIYLGLAIAGMHYTAMAAATFVPSAPLHVQSSDVLGTPTLFSAVVALSMLTLLISIAVGQMDRSLAQSSIRLRKEKEIRSHFVSAIIHDLRNPLTACTISVQMISKMCQQGASQIHSSIVLENLNRMNQLIQNLLDAHRISMGQPLPLRIERTHLRSLLETTLESLRGIYGDRYQLTCDHSIQGDWDPTLIRRAVENLCTNAVKYGARNSPIQVHVKANYPKLDRVSIYVQNQGKPISPEDKQNLFELFKRGQNSAETKQDGWGLGLTIVKGIVEAHQGSILVKSDAEVGTVFILEIPRNTTTEFQTRW